MEILLKYDPKKKYFGPQSWGLLLYLMPCSEKFNFAAYVHDLFFGKGGTYDDFLRANRIFRTMLFAVAETDFEKYCAGKYSYMVEKYGTRFYYFHWSEKGSTENSFSDSRECRTIVA